VEVDNFQALTRYSIYLSGFVNASAGDACTPTKIEILGHSPDILKPLVHVLILPNFDRSISPRSILKPD